MPWKYSPEKIIADKIVVACDVDNRLFRKNGFAKTDIYGKLDCQDLMNCIKQINLISKEFYMHHHGEAIWSVKM